jgi:F-type H+-transporting ATPase subunit delta
VKNLRIPRRYAKALLLIGKENGQAEAYRGQLGAVARLIEANKALEQALCNPLYETEGRRKVLVTLIERLGLAPMIKSFLTLLFDKGRIGFVGPIHQYYEKLADELKGVARATLVSAAALPEETVQKIRATLSQKTGKDIVLEVSQDASLIGGIVTRIGDLVLDGSIRTQLLNMRETLKRGESA